MRNKNRIRKIYKGYDKALKPFKTDMIKLITANKALAVAIAQTWRAETHKQQYYRAIEYFGFNHRNAYSDFCKTNIAGKVLCGEDRFWNTIRFCGHEDIYLKYRNSIPECKAFGLIFGHILKIINNRN